MSAVNAISVEAMQAIDAQAIEHMGIPRLLLMEHAGFALARAVDCLEPEKPVVVVCGKGFNGGDGLAAARHLHNTGHAVEVVLACTVADLRDEPRIFYEILVHLGISVHALDETGFQAKARKLIQSSCCVVDALLGVGISNEVREPYAGLIRDILASETRVISADVPSGLNADTGAVMGVAVKAVKTVTFGLAKKGCVTEAARDYVGELIVDPISFPPSLLASC